MRWAIAVLFSLLSVSALAQAPLRIVAAETVYGDVAGQLAGPRASVISILTDLAQDPHLFEASPSAARQTADAAIVVLNGADYDPWMRRLLAGTGRVPARQGSRRASYKRRRSSTSSAWWRPVSAFRSCLRRCATSAGPGSAFAPSWARHKSSCSSCGGIRICHPRCTSSWIWCACWASICAAHALPPSRDLLARMRASKRGSVRTRVHCQ